MAAVSSPYGGIEAGETKVVCAVGETTQTIQASKARHDILYLGAH